MQLVFLPVLVYQYWNAGSSLQCSIVWMHSCHYPTVFSFTNKGKGYCLCKYSGNYRQYHIHGYGFQTPYQRDIIWKVWCNPWQHLYSMQTKTQQEHLTTNSQNAPGGKLSGLLQKQVNHMGIQCPLLQPSWESNLLLWPRSHKDSVSIGPTLQAGSPCHCCCT